MRTTYAHFPIGKQATIKTAVNAGWFYSPNYFQNELFQIGDLQIATRFDESIYTDNFCSLPRSNIVTCFRGNSFLFGFLQIFGKAQYKILRYQYSHTYLGIGAGIYV